MGDAGSAGEGNITIGIKYDQPGLGQKDGETFKGFDVDVARYVAKELGYEENEIVFKETPSAQRETAIQGGQVALIFATYSITDARKEEVLVARSLHRRPGPAGRGGQHRHHRAGR